MTTTKLTKPRLDALRVAYAAYLQAPGRFVDLAGSGLARGVSGLVSLGYLEFVYGATVYGRRRHYAPRYYRLTDAGREICHRLLPAPRLAEPPAGLLRPRLVTRAQAEAIRADLAGYWKDMHILIHPDGSTLTLIARYPRDSRRAVSCYSPESYAQDLAQRVQMRLQHVAVISADVRPPRIAGHPPKAAITFRLFEPIPFPLLCAGQGGPALLQIASEPAVGLTWDEALAPAEVTPEAIWNDLTVEAQALLVLLSGQRGWQPVRGAVDSDLRVLDRELLIFWQRQLREARITARGLDLVEAMVSVEAAS